MCGLLCCLIIIFLGTVWCGMGAKPVPYNQRFSLSSGQCQGSNAAPVAGEQTLAIVVTTGPNITICTLRASDGTLLRHYDLDVHGDVVGKGDGLLYVLERDGGDGAARALCAIHIKDGLKRWCQPQFQNYDNPGSITTSSGKVYLRYMSQGDDLITAMSEQTGQILWSFRTFNSDSDISTHELIAVGNGIVYLGASQILPLDAPRPTPATTPGPGSICALQASNGHHLWCQALPLSARDICGMIVDEQSLYARVCGAGNDFLYALNTTDGSTRWQFSFPPPTQSYAPSPITVAHGMIFAAARNTDTISDQLYALQASDGKQLWSVSNPDVIASFIATDKLLYVVDSSTAIRVLNLLDGTAAWPHSLPSSSNSQPNDNGFSHIMVGQHVAYVFTYMQYDLHVLAVKTDNGAPLWEDKACTPDMPGTPRVVPTTPVTIAPSTPVVVPTTPVTIPPVTPFVVPTTPITVPPNTPAIDSTILPGNGRCYWDMRLGSGNMIGMQLLQADNS